MGETDEVQDTTNEVVRLEELSKYSILDTPEDPFYNDVAKMISQICGAPMSFISFLDEKELWLKAKVGLGVQRIPRELSMCRYLKSAEEVMIISDLSKDVRFQDSPFVVSAPFLRFYAGIPIVNDAGFQLGSLCVLDVMPRELNRAQMDSFHALQRIIVRDLESRRQSEERWKFMDAWVKPIFGNDK